MKRAALQERGTSNGTFQTKKVGEIDISFVEYSTSKSVYLTPDIVEYDAEANARGSGGKNVIFSNGPNPLLSVLIYSNRSLHYHTEVDKLN